MLGKVEGRRRRGQQRMRWLDGITDDEHEFEQAPGVGDGQGSLMCCSPWGHKESNTTEGLNLTELKKVRPHLRKVVTLAVLWKVTLVTITLFCPHTSKQNRPCHPVLIPILYSMVTYEIIYWTCLHASLSYWTPKFLDRLSTIHH